MCEGWTMGTRFRTLIINPKTNSTIIAVFQDSICLYKETINHPTSFYQEEAIPLEAKQRSQLIMKTIKQAGINLSKIDAIGANGGLLRPIPGGTYAVC